MLMRPQGIVAIDKPTGITSFDVVRMIRRKLNIKKVGHCGTLDPLATGLLVVLLGNATKLFSKFSCFDKVYEATLVLGVTTDTGDSQGAVIRNEQCNAISLSDVERVAQSFVGEITQTPPMFSALKYQGKKLYELARQGIEVPRKDRPVKIFSLAITKFYPPSVDFIVHCSKGVYVRSLAHDIGQRLGCGASITKIRRVSVGPFSIHEAVTIDELNESHIRHWPLS